MDKILASVSRSCLIHRDCERNNKMQYNFPLFSGQLVRIPDGLFTVTETKALTDSNTDFNGTWKWVRKQFLTDIYCHYMGVVFTLGLGQGVSIDTENEVRGHLCAVDLNGAISSFQTILQYHYNHSAGIGSQYRLV